MTTTYYLAEFFASEDTFVYKQINDNDDWYRLDVDEHLKGSWFLKADTGVPTYLTVLFKSDSLEEFIDFVQAKGFPVVARLLVQLV